MQNTETLLVSAHDARKQAIQWLLDNVSPEGVPSDAIERSGWPRLGWGLSIVGQSEVGARAVEWISANRIDASGGFTPGYTHGQGYISSYPLYWLGTFVVSAWVIGRYDIAMRSMNYIKSQQDVATGGLPMVQGSSQDIAICDILSTAQAGVSALTVGEHETAHACASWVRKIADQKASDGLTFYACMRGGELWTDPDEAVAWASVNDFSKPRQAFYPPAMGAVFLARYSMRYNCAISLEAAKSLLDFNLLGHASQFDDLESVQACKFGWAVAEMYHADRSVQWLEWSHRMTEWFLDRQAPEGWWGPSKFADPEPSTADKMVKTAEHVMELTRLMTVLGTSIAHTG